MSDNGVATIVDRVGDMERYRLSGSVPVDNIRKVRLVNGSDDYWFYYHVNGHGPYVKNRVLSDFFSMFRADGYEADKGYSNSLGAVSDGEISVMTTFKKSTMVS